MKLAAILALFSVAAVACTYVEYRPPQEVRSDFDVVIAHRGEPLAGVIVNLYRERQLEPFRTFVTPASGIVRISGLPQGAYLLNAEFLGISAVFREHLRVESRPSRDARTKLGYTWGGEAFSARTLAGTLLNLLMDANSPDFANGPKWLPEASVRIDSENVITRERRTAVSPPDGTFDFSPVPPGTYLLRMQAPTTRFPDLLVTVAPESLREKFSVKLNGAVCGGTVVE